jgi:O-antigen ligase
MIVLLATAALLGIAAIRWQRTFVMALPFLATLNGVAVSIAGASIRLDQLVACALVVPLAASTLIGQRTLRTDRTTWLLAAIVAVNVLATILNSPSRGYSLSQCANVASVWLIYIILHNLLETREDLDAFFRRTLWAAGVASLLAIGAYVLALGGLSIGGAEVSSGAALRFTSAYGAYGTMVEPNILGGFAAAYLVVCVSLLLDRTDRPGDESSAWMTRWVAGACAVALVLSFTRGAWVGAMAGIACLMIVRRRGLLSRIRFRRIIVPLAAAAVLVGALLAAPGDAGTLFRFKLANLLNVGTQTGITRLVQYTLAFQQWADHPAVGWGTFTFAPLVAQGNDFQQFDNWRNLWIGNYLLLALHDTGLIGLGLWIAMLWGMLTRGASVVRRLRVIDPEMAGHTLALTLAFVAILVAFLATSGFSLGYSWVLLGLLGAHHRLTDSDEAVALAEREAPGVEPETAPSPVV